VGTEDAMKCKKQHNGIIKDTEMQLD